MSGIRMFFTRATIRLISMVAFALVMATAAYAADEPDLIFRRSTVFKLLTPE